MARRGDGVVGYAVAGDALEDDEFQVSEESLWVDEREVRVRLDEAFAGTWGPTLRWRDLRFVMPPSPAC